jgi:hypothetical protein
LPLYYTGITGTANVTNVLSAQSQLLQLARDYSVTVQLEMPPRSYVALLIEDAS